MENISLTAVLAYLVIINIVAFVAYGIDKFRAKYLAAMSTGRTSKKRKKSLRRIPEKQLLGLAAAGGSVGALIGMTVWHHKTQHKKFIYGVPIILTIQLVLVIAFLLNLNIGQA